VYLRCLQSVSALIIIVFCCPVYCISYYRNRSNPFVEPNDLVEGLNTISIAKLKRLRSELNYTHDSDKLKQRNTKSDQINQKLINDEQAIDMICCICMDNF